MCQPGRPGPHGLSQVGSPGACACHSTKSRGSRLCGSSGRLPRSLATSSISDRGRWLSRPKAGPGIDVVVDAAARHVGEPALDQRADGGDDVGDDVGGARVLVRRADVQDLHVADEVRGPSIAEGAPVRADLGRLAQDVVVDVGDVLDVAHGQPLALEVPHEHVGDRVGEGVAEVRGVVGRDAAHVQGDGLPVGLERLDGAGERVVEVHAALPSRPGPWRGE